ncbi:hypothetical protein NIES4073_71790 [Kalymmatonema gypsitolerans NIES-4073]|nr:hypothetical protein NIES4073_71790 [Scytonema sp. NIES-4073]
MVIMLMNTKKFDSFSTEITEEELKSCNGGILGGTVGPADDAVDQTIDNINTTVKLTIDGTQDAVALVTGPGVGFVKGAV